MQVVLDNPIILMTDHKIQSTDELEGVLAIAEQHQRPLLIIAEELAPPAITGLLARRDKGKVKVAAIHPPEFGHWRKSMLEDIAVATDGRVIARDLGGTVAGATAEDLGGARQVRISANKTLITAGEGRPEAVAARREQVKRQHEAAPENVERDKFKERLAKLSGGTAMILAGGATPVEQKRTAQLIEDAINATRAAIEEGIVAGGGMALIHAAPPLDGLIKRLKGDEKVGAELVQRALSQPLACIITNSGRDAAKEMAKSEKSANGHGFDARSGGWVDMFKAGIVDPVRVVYSALRNAGSVAALILTTQTLIAKKPDDYDPTAGPARGGGAELL
jgi:chaperonin GroEL